MVTVELCNKIIPIMLAVTIVFGVATGYYNYIGEKELIFVPMIAGFICVWITYFFIQLKGDLLAGKKVDKY